MFYIIEEKFRIQIQEISPASADCSDYILNININNKRDSAYQIYFESPYGLVTGRDKKSYLVQDMYSDLQYIEIGAGFSEFIPSLVKKFGNALRHKPIIIDPVNYEVLKSMLCYATELGLGETYDSRLDVFIERIDIITDSSKVLLLNHTLGDAIREYPEIQGIGDVIIDVCGPTLFPEMENRDECDDNLVQLVIDYERSLKKDGNLDIDYYP